MIEWGHETTEDSCEKSIGTPAQMGLATSWVCHMGIWLPR